MKKIEHSQAAQIRETGKFSCDGPMLTYRCLPILDFLASNSSDARWMARGVSCCELVSIV